MVCKIYDPGMISQKHHKNEVLKTNQLRLKTFENIFVAKKKTKWHARISN